MKEINFNKNSANSRIDTEYDRLSKSAKNIGHMMCWDEDKELGDTNPFQEPFDLLNEMIHQEYIDESIIRYVKKHPSSNDLEIKYDRNSGRYTLTATYSIGYWHPGEVRRSEVGAYNCIESLEDAVIAYLPTHELITMLQKKGYIFFPINNYDKSGLTICIDSSLDCFDDFLDQWNLSTGREKCYDKDYKNTMVGFIYIKRQDVLDNLVYYWDEAGKKQPIISAETKQLKLCRKQSNERRKRI